MPQTGKNTANVSKEKQTSAANSTAKEKTNVRKAYKIEYFTENRRKKKAPKVINGTCTGFKEQNDVTDYNFYLPNEKADDNIVYVFDANNNLIRGICDKFTNNINPPTIIPITSQKIPRLTYDVNTKLDEKVNKIIADNLEAYCELKKIDKTKRDRLQLHLIKAAYVMLSYLWDKNFTEVQRYKVDYKHIIDILNKYNNIIDDKSSTQDFSLMLDRTTSNEFPDTTNPDGPMFLDFVYGYTTNKNKIDYSYQPNKLHQANILTQFHTNHYNKNMAGLIACCVYLEYKYENEKYEENALKLDLIKEDKELMCFFAHLTSKVYDFMVDDIIEDKCDLEGISIIKLINSETKNDCENYTLRKYVVQIYAAAMVLSMKPANSAKPANSVKPANSIPTYKEFYQAQENNSQYKNKFELVKNIIEQRTIKLTNNEVINNLKYVPNIINKDNLINAHNRYVKFFTHPKSETNTNKNITERHHRSDIEKYITYKNDEYYKEMITNLNLSDDIKTKLEALKKYQQEGVASDNADKKKGGKNRNLLKVSDKRVMINGKSRVVYVRTHGGKYIKASGNFVTVKSAMKSAKNKSKK